MRVVVKIIVIRASKHSATWELCHADLCRIQQVMANNNFPQPLTENRIINRLSNHFQTNAESEKNAIELYYQLCNISTISYDTNTLKDIGQRHLKATPLINK